MDRLIYSSLSAMRGAMARQTAVANNLANANTSGFRAELSAARALWNRGGAFEGRATQGEEVVAADMTGGAVSATGRDLDVALNKDALLAVQAREGGEAYTRRGDLKVTDNGLLATGDGLLVLGEGGGPITLPPADQVMIDPTGTISIIPQGGNPAQPQQVDRLKLVSPSGSQIAKGMDGLFRGKAGATLPADPDATLASQSLEGSNVNVSASLVQMIEASRAWETQVKMLTTAQDLDRASADLMRLPE